MRSSPPTPMFAKPAHDQDPAPERPKPRWRKVARNLSIVTSLLLVAAVATTALWAGSLGSKFNEERNVIDLAGHPGNAQPDMSEFVDPREDPPAPEPSEEPAEAVSHTAPVNVLLLGSDVRPDAAKGDARSDTIMVAHVAADRSSVQIMSLPRDMWVPIPGHGQDRINSAFTHGGAGLTMATIEDLLGIELHHVVMIDFDGFAELTTALGGVTVDNPTEFTTTHGPDTTFAQGEITLEGDQALQYVRERKAFPDSDLTRVENQQRVVSAVMNKLLGKETLSRPDKISSVLDTMLPYVSVDEELTAEKLVSYAIEARDLRGDDIASFTVPTGAPFTTSQGAQVLGTNDAALEELRTAFKQETVDDYAEAHSG